MSLFQHIIHSESLLGKDQKYAEGIDQLAEYFKEQKALGCPQDNISCIGIHTCFPSSQVVLVGGSGA